MKLGERGGLVWLKDQHRAQRDGVDSVIVNPGELPGRCLHESAGVEQSTLMLICGGFIIGTFIVGSLMWSVMINPFRQLAQHARAINAQSNPEEVQVPPARYQR